jgi:hypothetical protein
MVTDNLISPKQRRLGHANRNEEHKLQAQGSCSTFKLQVPKTALGVSLRAQAGSMAYLWQTGFFLENNRNFEEIVVIGIVRVTSERCR